MRSVFQNLSFGSRSEEVIRERAEPRLLPASAPIEFRRPANVNLSASREQAPKSAITPALSVVERHPPSPSEPVPGSVRSMVIAGCVAFVIAGIASAGFLWLRTPPGEPANSGAHGSPEVSQIGHAPTPPSPAPATTQAAAAAIPQSAALSRAVSSITAPKPRGDVPQTVSRTALSDRTLAATPGEKTASPHRLPIATTPQQHRATITATTAAPDHRVMAPAPAIHRSSRLHTEARHTHVKPTHDVRSSQSETSTLRPPISEAARSSRAGDTPTVQPTDQSAAFGQLLTNLTGSAKPAAATVNQASTPPPAGSTTGFDQLLAHLTESPKPADRASGQTLTPPAAGSPDPFAQHTLHQ